MDLSYEQREDLGLKYVLDLLEPACPYGVKRLRAEGFYTPARREKLERELNQIALLREELAANRDAVMDLRHVLSALKDLSGTFSNCEEGVLSEVELFELTAFCLRMRSLIPKFEQLHCFSGLTEIRFSSVEAALKILDPSAGGRLSFYIEDTRSPELLWARTEKREAEKLLRQPGAEKPALTARRMKAVKAEVGALAAIRAEMSLELRELRWFYGKRIDNPNTHGTGCTLSSAIAANLAKGFTMGEAVARAKEYLSGALAAMRHVLRSERRRMLSFSLGGDTLRLSGAVNPRIADALERRGRTFTPISAELPRGVTVLTGANMGGKSVAIHTVALNLALTLMGCFPFAEQAEVPLFDHVELINRDFSSAEGGLSSFGGEIIRLNDAVERLAQGGLSFIAMDEFARGTNAKEGAAIARGVVRYLAGKNAVTLLATHYDGTRMPALPGARSSEAFPGHSAARRSAGRLAYD